MRWSKETGQFSEHRFQISYVLIPIPGITTQWDQGYHWSIYSNDSYSKIAMEKDKSGER